MSNNRYIDKETVRGILLDCKEIGNLAFCYNVDRVKRVIPGEISQRKNKYQLISQYKKKKKKSKNKSKGLNSIQ